MELKDYLYKETIECLPSTDLREHLISFQMNLSLMQKATIIDRFAKPTDKIVLFKRLAEFTPSTNERDLLLCAVDDIKNRGYVDTATVELYNARFPHEGPPFYPFTELCYLPQLFKEHDLLRYKGKVYDVVSTPKSFDYCDFSDECYLCYPLVGEGHEHIHYGEAERASNEEVVKAMQQGIASAIEEGLDDIEKGRVRPAEEVLKELREKYGL